LIVDSSWLGEDVAARFVFFVDGLTMGYNQGYNKLFTQGSADSNYSQPSSDLSLDDEREALRRETERLALAQLEKARVSRSYLPHPTGIPPWSGLNLPSLFLSLSPALPLPFLPTFLATRSPPILIHPVEPSIFLASSAEWGREGKKERKKKTEYYRPKGRSGVFGSSRTGT